MNSACAVSVTGCLLAYPYVNITGKSAKLLFSAENNLGKICTNLNKSLDAG
jgi:hypothetical protein